MGYKQWRSVWLLSAGIGAGCGDGAIVDVDTSGGTESTTDTTDGPTTDPTIEPTTVSDTMPTTSTDVTTDPTDTTPTTDETTDTDPTDTDTDPTDTDPTSETSDSDSDTDPSTSTDPSDSDAETTVGVSDTDETTDSESDSDTDSESDSVSVSIGFIVDPDAGGVALECDIWEQDCPEGDKCMPWANDGGNSWNATRCSPLDPNPAQIGDVCTVEGSGVSGIDSCDISLMCWNVDPETNEGTCIGMCQGSEQNPVCADPQTSCAIVSDGVLAVCLPNCDPLLQDCDGDEVCIPIVDNFICAPDSSGEQGQQGDGCEFLNVCNPGLLCAGSDLVPDCQGASGCCTTFCDVTAGDADAFCVGEAGMGTSCVPFFEDGQAPPGDEDVGICVLPE